MRQGFLIIMHKVKHLLQRCFPENWNAGTGGRGRYLICSVVLYLGKYGTNIVRQHICNNAVRGL
jgi:hypothetical protein